MRVEVGGSQTIPIKYENWNYPLKNNIKQPNGTFQELFFGLSPKKTTKGKSKMTMLQNEYHQHVEGNVQTTSFHCAKYTYMYTG